jgi:N-acetylmuramoyl-L-alanine amidase
MLSFPPDSPLVDCIAASPNHEERKLHGRIDILLLHYTGMASTDIALARLRSPEANVSAHYLVSPHGSVMQLVPEARRAFHAGTSSWEGSSDINSRSIGIEIANPGHDAGSPEFPRTQIEATIALCRDIVQRRGIRADRVLAHSDVAPERKNDPGEAFPWTRLAAAGVGLWVEPGAIMPGPRLGPSDKGPAVVALQRDLARFGYGLTVTAAYDTATRAVVTAFQRHFRPALVDGVADRSTLATLAALLAAKDRLLQQAAGI